MNHFADVMADHEQLTAEAQAGAAIAVVSLLDPNTPREKRRMYDLSLMSIRAYAERLGVPLVILTGRKYAIGQWHRVPHLEKLQALDLLDYFERVLCLDLDILIAPQAPNIFAMYPNRGVNYGFNEGHLSWVAEDRRLFERRYGIDYPGERMLNGGVMLWSRTARPITQYFDPANFYPSFGGTAGEQSWVNMMLAKLDLPVGYLDARWNWCIYSRDVAYFDERFRAWALHYAADGEWIGRPSKYRQICDDAGLLGV